jgi:16S rRNA (adenine1518-N6/adenine1519-N6)-dimethyltransferase
MKLTEMKQLLAARGIKLTKSLGQNFLHDANRLRRIVAAAELKGTDRVLEIGPGLGPLTELLVEQAVDVLAIEKDARLVEVLEERFKAEHASPLSPLSERTNERPSLRLMHDDALEYLKRGAHDWSAWKLVANLPYSVASPILVELAQHERGPERMVVTLQHEVAHRLLAQAGTRDYGLLTLLVQLNYAPHAWFKIPASCFFPEPEVGSACVCLIRREPRPLTDSQRKSYVQIVKRGFSQRRKMMFKLLKADWPEPGLVQAFERVQLSQRMRAEEVSLDQFTQLAKCLSGFSK